MRILIFILFFALMGCGDSNNDNTTTEPETIIYDYPDTLLAFEVDADSMFMKRQTIFPDSSITISRIINGLNDKYPNVRIVFLKQSGDTVYTEVPNADYLGEQMGNAGSSAWFADATINLTSVPGVNYVSYKMDLHSHAASNVIGRDAYRDWKKE
jgi:hypothetical protein